MRHKIDIDEVLGTLLVLGIIALGVAPLVASLMGE